MIMTRLHFPEGSGLAPIALDQEWPCEHPQSLGIGNRWFMSISTHLELIEGRLVRVVHLADESA